MKVVAILRVFLVSSLLALPLQAQQRSLSLDEAISTALTNNRDLHVARLEVDRADAAAKEALGNALPSLNVTGNYTRNIKSPVFFFPNQQTGQQEPVKIGANNAFTATAQLTQVIFNSAVFTGVGTAKTYQDAAREQYKGMITQTILSVREAYYNALFAREGWQLLQQSLGNAEENLRNVQVLYREGLVAEYDAIRAEVTVENIRPQVLQAEQQYKDAQNALKLVLGIEVGEQINLTSDFDYQAAEQPTLQILQERMLNNNYTLRSLELQQRVNEELIDIQQSEYLPTLALFGNYTFQGQSDDFNFTTVSSAAAGMNLSLSLFQGFQTTARVQQAQIDYMKIQQQIETLSQSLKLQAESVSGQIDNARRRVEAQGRTVEQAQRGYDIAQIRYKAGTGTQVEINDADLALRQARLNRLQSIYDYLVAQARLEQLIGDLQSRYLQTVPAR